MDAGFTKGPWKATHSDPAEGVDCWWITANVMDNNGEKEICSVPSGYRSVDANAYLIAAAPDLFEALKPFVDWYNIREHQRGLTGGPKHDDDTPIFMAASIEGEVLITLGALRRARAALLKATGETK